jgi:capsule polysaccharide export protein KpsE/RkpR
LKQDIQKHENDLISVKTANGDMDILLAIKDLNERKEISNIKNNLTANKNNIQSLLLIYTPEHPKVSQAYELDKSLKNQLKTIVDEVIQKKVFELSNLKNFINLSRKDLENAKNELMVIEEKEAGMLNFSREVESSRKLYETFLQRVKETNEAQNLQISKLKIIETPNLPGGPFSPKPFKNFLTALLLSFFGFKISQQRLTFIEQHDDYNHQTGEVRNECVIVAKRHQKILSARGYSSGKPTPRCPCLAWRSLIGAIPFWPLLALLAQWNFWT